MTLVKQTRRLKRSRMPHFLAGLEAGVSGEARSLYLPAGFPSSEIQSSLSKITFPPEVSVDVARAAEDSPNGIIIFLSTEGLHLILPPFPIAEKHSSASIDTKSLKALLTPDYTIAIILVRLGSYAIGVCQGEKLLSSKVGTGLVHSRHKKGGSSQHRFARHRDKQIEYFLTRVCQHVLEHLRPHEKTLDFLVYGGAWTTVQLLEKQCAFLERFAGFALQPLLDIPEPRQAVLATVIERVWSTTVVEWRET